MTLTFVTLPSGPIVTSITTEPCVREGSTPAGYTGFTSLIFLGGCRFAPTRTALPVPDPDGADPPTTPPGTPPATPPGTPPGAPVVARISAPVSGVMPAGASTGAGADSCDGASVRGGGGGAGESTVVLGFGGAEDTCRLSSSTGGGGSDAMTAGIGSEGIRIVTTSGCARTNAISAATAAR